MFATINIAPRAGGEDRKLLRTRSHTQQPKKSVLEKDEEEEEEDENGGKT
jgi:hypothetical protein